TLADAYDMIGVVGEMVGKKENAAGIISEAKASFRKLKFQSAVSDINSTPTAAYLIWRNPYMTIGSDTFIHHLLTTAGFRNIFEYEKRYPQITIEELKDRSPQYVLLSSEPYPFRGKHVEE